MSGKCIRSQVRFRSKPFSGKGKMSNRQEQKKEGSFSQSERRTERRKKEGRQKHETKNNHDKSRCWEKTGKE